MMPVMYKRTPQRRQLSTTIFTLIALAGVFYIGRLSLRLSTSSAPAATNSSYQEYSSTASVTSTSSSTNNNLHFRPTALDITSDLPIEIWAQSRPQPSGSADVRSKLNNTELANLEQLCGRTLYHGLQNVVVSHDNGQRSFFATG